MKTHPYSLVYVSAGQHRNISFRTKEAAIATAQTMSTPAPGSPAWDSWELLKRENGEIKTVKTSTNHEN